MSELTDQLRLEANQREIECRRQLQGWARDIPLVRLLLDAAKRLDYLEEQMNEWTERDDRLTHWRGHD